MKIRGTINRLRSSRTGRIGMAALAVAMAGVLLSACQKGTYAVDIFPEQHYQQSLKRQEPVRLTPPDGAVPITGREIPVDPATAGSLGNPVQASPEVIQAAAELFRVNCSICHGPEGRGDGTVASRLVQYQYVSPPDLTAQTTQQRTDGEIFGIITNGVFVMPRFGALLTEQQRWELVHYIRYLAQPAQ